MVDIVFMDEDKNKKGKIGLVMTGGGAHAAYQVGVLLALTKMLPKSSASPFSVICGTSAGAINAVALGQFHNGSGDSFRFLGLNKNRSPLDAGDDVGRAGQA